MTSVSLNWGWAWRYERGGSLGVCRPEHGKGCMDNHAALTRRTKVFEDFLRALGDAAARQRWTALRLLRVGDDTILRCGARGDRKEIVLAAHDVEAMLNRAFRQRGQGPLS